MLRRFLYLDTVALNQYVTALEGGLTVQSTRRQKRGGTAELSADAKVVKATTGKAREHEESRTLSDTDEARFDRLLEAAAEDAEQLAWVEVTDADTDLKDIGIGAMVSWECDLYVPEVIQVLAQSGEATGAIQMMQQVLPAARAMGFATDTPGLPSEEELKATADFISGLNASMLVVGEDEETDRQVAGHVARESLGGQLDGRARLVGKVSKVISPGQWQPYVTFPGMNILSRAERRQRAKQTPPPGKENEYLAGPALLLDLLAIYR